MEKPTYKIAGAPCGTHGPYTFHKALRLQRGGCARVLAVGEFCFVKIWPDSELIAIGELQLLWTDRVLDKTLVGLRLYFLPENTPLGRRGHGEHEVLVINEKVVLRVEDFLTWLSDGTDWRLGLPVDGGGRAGAVSDADDTQALILSRLDFSDVERERESIERPWPAASVAVLSYPAYCRQRARRARGAAAAACPARGPGARVLYCRDTFEYPELEGHELVCNQLLPRARPRPRRRRRRTSADLDRSDEDYIQRTPAKSGAERSEGEGDAAEGAGADAGAGAGEGVGAGRADEDRAFMKQLKAFYRSRGESFRLAASVKEVSLPRLYAAVRARGGYAAAAWRLTHAALAPRPAHHADTKLCYERFLLSYENHERRTGTYRTDAPVDTIVLAESPLREPSRTPSPKPEPESKPAEELNREFLDSLPEDAPRLKTDGVKEEGESERDREAGGFLSDLAIKYLGTSEPSISPPDSALSSLTALSDKYVTNGHSQDEQKQRPAGRSSLRSVRVKPARVLQTATSTTASHRPDSASSSPPVTSAPTPTNFGINYPPGHVTSSEDDVVEVPYRPRSPEVIDLDEYPESPQTVKKKKLDILKERGLEVTTVPFSPANPFLSSVVQQQILQQTQLLHLYSAAPSYPNGAPPPKVIQGKSIYGSYGPEKTVYNHPKDPFMPPPHILQGAPIRAARSVPAPPPTPQEILDLTCKAEESPKAAVEIVRVPTAPSPHKTQAQNLTKNYTLVDGKAVVGSNLEITLVKNQTPKKPQKRSSNGKFTKTPPKDASPSSSKDRPSLVIPSYQAEPGDPKAVQNFLDPLYMNALYSSLAHSLDGRQLAMYRELLARQARSYSGLVNAPTPMTPTTKN